MRRPITAAALLLPTLIAALRALQKPLYAGLDTYAALLTTPMSGHEHFLYQLLALATLLIAAQIATSKYRIPAESVLVLAATPALLTTLVTTGPHLTIAIIALAAAITWEHPPALAATSTLLAATHTAGALLALPITIALYTRKAYWSASALLVLGGAAATANHTGITLTAPLAELGALGGVSTFILLLALTGILLHWDTDTYPYLLLATITIFAGMFVAELGLVVALASAAASGYALHALRTRDWKLPNIRYISILLVACGLLFTAASTASQAVREAPGHDLAATADYLAQLPPGAVHAHPRHAPALRYHGVNATTVPDERITRSIDETGPHLPRYVVLHEDERAPNLRFLIENTDDFALLYSDGYTVWEHTG